MKTYFANPIYDSVFKYLMEDERIARTLVGLVEEAGAEGGAASSRIHERGAEGDIDVPHRFRGHGSGG